MARYRVTLPPGAYVPDKGFFPVGSELELKDDASPSKTFVPLDEAAVRALAKIGVKAVLAAPPAPSGEAVPPKQLGLDDKPQKRASDKLL